MRDLLNAWLELQLSDVTQQENVFLSSSGQQETLDVVSVDWIIYIIYITTEPPALSLRFPPSFRYLCQPESVITLPTASGSNETGIQWNFNLEAMSYSSCGIKYLHINKYGSLDRQHHFISAVAIICSSIAISFLNISSSTEVCLTVMLCTSSKRKSALRHVFQNISHLKLQTPLTQA